MRFLFDYVWPRFGLQQAIPKARDAPIYHQESAGNGAEPQLPIQPETDHPTEGATPPISSAEDNHPSDAELQLLRNTEEMARLRDELARERSRLKRFKRLETQAQAACVEYEARCLKAEAEHATLENQLQSAEKALIDSQDQVNTLARRLDDAQRDLAILREAQSTHDDVSAEDVGNILKDINDRIEQTACETANIWLYDQLPPSRPGWEGLASAAHDRMVEVLGSLFVDVLQGIKVRHKSALFFLQKAFQACLVKGVGSLLEAFSSAIASTPQSAYFSKIGREIQAGESQPVFGRWRSMTHEYIKRLEPEDKKAQVIEYFVDQMIKDCFGAITLLFGDRSPEEADLVESFGQDVHEIVTLTITLLDTIREKVVTGEYAAVSPCDALKWRFNSAVMNASDPQSAPEVGAQVMCTVRLGLSKKSKAGRERAAPLKHMVFRKAEVVTLNCLQYALGDSDPQYVDTYSGSVPPEDSEMEVSA